MSLHVVFASIRARDLKPGAILAGPPTGTALYVVTRVNMLPCGRVRAYYVMTPTSDKGSVDYAPNDLLYTGAVHREDVL